MENIIKAVILSIFSVSIYGAAAQAEVKRGDSGATCTASTETINGKKASCESCTATKCDTAGDTITNCRRETTKTCTIDGRVVSPVGGKLENVAPRGDTLMRKSN
ncbi:hypothetical protein [Fulvimarina pelagi]|uniref:hypothetical protein n=1 Tax=Fulvimarina pelagi TaxID=217511 RepID=UPI0011D0FB2C|nr:hypothetical protein [Fulvimarina pelagi]